MSDPPHSQKGTRIDFEYRKSRVIMWDLGRNETVAKGNIYV